MPPAIAEPANAAGPMALFSKFCSFCDSLGSKYGGAGTEAASVDALEGTMPADPGKVDAEFEDDSAVLMPAAPSLDSANALADARHKAARRDTATKKHALGNLNLRTKTEAPTAPIEATGIP